MNQRLLQLQARAFRRHGIPREQFLKTTPSELAALDAIAKAEWERDYDLAEHRTARIQAAIFNNNPNRKRGAKKFTAEDFLPKKQNPSSLNASAEDLFAKVKWKHHAIRSAAKNQKNGR